MENFAKRNRILVLNQRLEKIINLNKEHNYTSSFSNERKIKQYYALLVKIRSEKQDLRMAIRESDQNYNTQIQKSKSNVIEVLRNHFLYNINPTV